MKARLYRARPQRGAFRSRRKPVSRSHFLDEEDDYELASNFDLGTDEKERDVPVGPDGFVGT
jgi:hypothetical protein